MSAVRDWTARLEAAAPSLRRAEREERRFPAEKPASIAGFFGDYRRELNLALSSVPAEALAKAEALVRDCLARDAAIFSCGNGGSAAIANHLVCDYGKGLRMDTGFRARVRSLSASAELLTAVANDLSYAEVFCYQLEGAARPGDLLIAISSSGDSENIVRAVEWARQNGVHTLALTGFSGGRASKLAEVNLHVDSQNYGIVEDVHQSLMHVVAQYLRVSEMPDELVAQRRF